MSAMIKIILLIIGMLAGVLFWSSLSETLKKWAAISLTVIFTAIASGWIGYQLQSPATTSTVKITATAISMPTVLPTVILLPPSHTPFPKLTAGTSNGTLAEGEVDTYSFTAQDRVLATIKVETVGLLFPFYVQVNYAADDGLITRAANGSVTFNGLESSRELSFAPEPGIEYHIKVEAYKEHGGSYFIKLTTNPMDE
jgi:hypothetical protein